MWCWIFPGVVSCGCAAGQVRHHGLGRAAVEGVAISALNQAANAAHEPASILPAAQFVDLGFDVKKLDALEAAVNQARHAIQKSQAKEIPIDEQQKR